MVSPMKVAGKPACLRLLSRCGKWIDMLLTIGLCRSSTLQRFAVHASMALYSPLDVHNV